MDIKGKRALVLGVANNYSIAYGIAKALAEGGAELILSYASPALLKRVLPITEELGAKHCLECDVSKDYSIRELFSQVSKLWDGIDIVVHSIAYAPKDELNGAFHECSRNGFLTAMDISVYSLVACLREAKPLMKPGASAITLSYYGAEKVVPHYGVMGVVKAALEASVRYLAHSLGPDGIRVNAISAGPIKTLSSAVIGGVSQMQKRIEKSAPLERNISLEDIAKTALYLLSDYASGVTGETIYVDAGINIMAY
ncbi:MAG: enoyl-ACP reductase [Candidatus Cloacimonadota bacterium]